MITLTNPTPAQIDAAVAEHVAGWTDIRMEEGENVDIDSRTIYPWKAVRGTNRDGERRFVSPYSTSADAVLPYIESKWDAVITRLEVNKAWQVDLVPSGGEYVVADGSASTLPMAACLALLRAHGVTVELTTKEGK